MPTNARYYTLDQARAILPEIQEHMEAIQAARREILRLRPEAWPAIEKAATNGGSHAAGKLAVQVGIVEDHVRAILEKGIYIKDLDQGIIDFLGRRANKEVLLCWQYGEDELAYWHDMEAGFAGRQPIDDEVE